MTNILILTHNYPRWKNDFAGSYIALLANRLTTLGYRPIVLAPHDPGAPEYEILDGVAIYRFRYAKSDEDETLAYRGNMHQLVLGSVTGIFKFKQFLDAFRTAAFDIIAKEQIDVVAGHWLIPSGIVMKTIASKTNLPMILSSHGTDIRLMSKYFQISNRFFKSFFPRLYSWTVVSSFLRDEIIRLEPGLATKLHVLPLPHDETIFYRDEIIPRESNLVMAATRFTEQKRVDYLIRAFAQVNAQLPSTRLEIYADGPLRAEMDRLIEELGLQSAVKITPKIPQEELRRAYNRASILVLNSVREGFGLALSEAMLCGAPVIGASSGGIVDIIQNEKTGLLVEPDNVESLASAMHRLLTDSPLRNKLGAAGYASAQESYGSIALARKFANIVDNAIAAKRQ